MIKKIKFTKSIILVPACIVLISFVVGGTIAWLRSGTNLLVSDFSYGDIKISIVEGNTNEDNSINYEILPGTQIIKDTVIVVEEKSEDNWLYIKIEQTDNFNDYMTYLVDDGWKKLEGYEDVYYREVNKLNEKQEFNVIKDKVINVRKDLTKKDFDLLTDENYPTLSISAYAIQRNEKMDEIDTAEEAWLLAIRQEN